MSFYDNSPGLIDDIKPTTAAPEQPAPAVPAVASPAAAALLGDAQPTKQIAAALPASDGPAEAVPEAIQELRKADQQIFDAQGMHGVAVREAFDDLIDPLAPAAERDASLHEIANIVGDLGASHSDLNAFASDARTFMRQQPTEEQERGLQAQCAKGLRDKYGAEADRVADLTRRLVARDPRVARYLNESGLGNHPATVLRFAEMARREQMRGRLK